MSDASYYQGLANQESQNHDNAISQKAAVDEKISRLETAKSDLSTQINNFQTGIIDALTKIKGKMHLSLREIGRINTQKSTILLIPLLQTIKRVTTQI